MVGGVGVLLFKNKAAMGGRGHELEYDKVVAVDRTGHSFMCDPEDEPFTVRPLPSLTAPKFSPFSVLPHRRRESLRHGHTVRHFLSFSCYLSSVVI